MDIENVVEAVQELVAAREQAQKVWAMGSVQADLVWSRVDRAREGVEKAIRNSHK